jgi:hypothetical protein
MLACTLNYAEELTLHPACFTPAAVCAAALLCATQALEDVSGLGAAICDGRRTGGCRAQHLAMYVHMTLS